MEEKKLFKVTSNPIVRTPRGTDKIMLDVIIALVPALGVGAYMFGMNVAILLCVNVVCCVFFEWAYRKLMKKNNTIGDLSAVVTAVLITCVMPSAAPWWLGIIGSFFAIVVVKQLYGGIGKNFLNPALAARAFLSAAYAAYMTAWAVPSTLRDVVVDATTMSTPLSYMHAGDALPEYFTFGNMFLGGIPGSIGEISALALLIGGAYLLIRKVITWRIPVTFIGTVAVLTLIFGCEGYSNVDWMLYNVLSGGLFLGAFFMATDYSTSPVNLKGQLLYGVGCGAITVLIRYFGSYPEGVSYAILIMNCCAWAIDKAFRPRQFGMSKEDVKAKKAAAKAAKKQAKEAAAQ
ncbi:MAG TPA: RnfABCDGE type electron transport complex subunit D [Candidatus Scatomorpha merdigallinarum]|nr:RnfABCDGE type electron transport complex subunit D [Candidatus Scatomorpha merdigallinarum]